MSAVSATQLRDFEIPNIAEFRDGPGGLVYLDVRSPHANAQIFLQGAHVTAFHPTGESPVLFVSEKSYYAPGKPIRGGVPVIFPWFGPRAGFPDAPAHGFARTLSWDVESLASTPTGEVVLILRLESNAETRAAWPHAFVLRYTVTIGTNLDLKLSVENRSETAINFEEALHTYLAVEDVREVTVSGLAGTEYIDKVDALRRKPQTDELIRFIGETDRVYLNTTSVCVADDPRAGRRLRVDKQGSNTTVVWNPWIAKAAALADFGDDEWPQMVCIETTNAAENAVTLEPHSTHEMRAIISIER